jgi:diguanylate cyclase (GGDEF)-like protein
MSDRLHRCATTDEAYGVVGHFAGQLFARQSGGVYLFDAEHHTVKAVASWGGVPMCDLAFTADACKVLWMESANRMEDFPCVLGCENQNGEGVYNSICVPLIIHGEKIGIFRLCSRDIHSDQSYDTMRRLARIVAEHLVLALTNLRMRERLRDLAIRDALTGLFNRRYLDETLERELQRAERHNHPVGVIILDIDHFKEFNTIHGLRGGDAALRAVGKFLQTSIRGEDVACRFGGEEFTLVLPQASLEDTRKRAAQLRERICNLKVVYNGRILRPITVSLGVSCFPLHGANVETVISAADHALGRAKAEGRDRVVIAEVA